MKDKLAKLKTAAAAQENANKKFLKHATKKKKRQLDTIFHDAHDVVFEKIDCLKCGNCCKTLGPRLTDKDVERISRTLKIKMTKVYDTYLKIDEDGDTVFKHMPCPFLLSDNYCSIYASRPKACREYPHTDRTNIFQIKSLMLKNSYTCPAVLDILEIARDSSI